MHPKQSLPVIESVTGFIIESVPGFPEGYFVMCKMGEGKQSGKKLSLCFNLTEKYLSVFRVDLHYICYGLLPYSEILLNERFALPEDEEDLIDILLDCKLYKAASPCLV